MTGEELNELYGCIIMPDANISVPEQWMPAVHEALQTLHDLPGSVRAFLIVTSIVEEDGDLTVAMIASIQYISDEAWRQSALSSRRRRPPSDGGIDATGA